MRAIIHDQNAYREAYYEARKIARQVEVLAGYAPPGLALAPAVERYASDPQYANLGEKAFAHILLEQLVTIEHQAAPQPAFVPPGLPDYPKAREQPDRLTLARLNELLAPHLITAIINLDTDDSVGQLRPILVSDFDYVALAKKGRYNGIVTRSVLDGLVLDQLLTA